jgi:probable rRNA maturation factor
VIVFETKLKSVSRSALERFARRAQRLAGVQGEVAVLITGSRRIRDMNRRFRRKDNATDVLSFPRTDGGDIAICAPLAAANARLYGLTPLQEFKILVLHGMLHLAGYDHETDSGDMARKEAALRSRLKLPASLIQRTLSPGTGSHSPAARKRKTNQRTSASARSRP